MLDLRFIRANPDFVKEGARRKRASVDIDELLETDREALALRQQVERLRAQQGEVSRSVPKASGDERATLIAQEQTSFVQTVNAYVGVIQARQLLALQRNNEQVLAKQLESTNDRYRVGEITRTDAVNMRVAAVVTQVMSNGNLVIAGKQEMVVNYELRELKVSGVIRPEDISSQNSINYDQIAEARIAYGGRGQITDVQQPRYGQQVMDIVLPF